MMNGKISPDLHQLSVYVIKESIIKMGSSGGVIISQRSLGTFGSECVGMIVSVRDATWHILLSTFDIQLKSHSYLSN